MLKKFGLFALSMLLLISTALANGAEVGINSDTAMQMLVDGNKRFVTEKYGKIHMGRTCRNNLLKGQHPFAIVVSCSDSRVPPE